MRRTGMALALASAFALASASGAGLASEAADLAQVRRAIDEFRAAVNRGDGEAAAATWAEDAVFMGEGMRTLKGKEVADLWRRNVAGGFRTKDPEVLELVVSGDTAYEVVSHLWTVHREGRPDEWLPSKYVHIWNRRSDGSWKLHLDIWNNTPPPKPAGTGTR